MFEGTKDPRTPGGINHETAGMAKCATPPEQTVDDVLTARIKHHNAELTRLCTLRMQLRPVLLNTSAATIRRLNNLL